MLKLHDLPEYSIATSEMRMRAASTPELFGYAIQNAEKMGLKISDQTVLVRCNDGLEHTVPMSVKFSNIAPDAKLKRVFVDKNGKRVAAIMLKGSSPKVKSAIYFTTEDFENSEGLIGLKQAVLDKNEEYRDGVIKRIRDDLRKNLPEIAVIAMNELPNIIKSAADKSQAAYDWFKNNGFEIVGLTPSKLDPFVSHVNDTSLVPSSYVISVEDDKWGHTLGASVEIDFAMKKISTCVWSSDD